MCITRERLKEFKKNIMWTLLDYLQGQEKIYLEEIEYEFEDRHTQWASGCGFNEAYNDIKLNIQFLRDIRKCIAFLKAEKSKRGTNSDTSHG